MTDDKPKPTVAGYRMKKIREILCMTQEQVAEQLGTTRISYRKWESAGHVPSAINRMRILDWFGRKMHEHGLRHDYIIIPEDFHKESPYGQVKRPLNLDK